MPVNKHGSVKNFTHPFDSLGSDFIWDFEKLPFPSHLGKFSQKIRNISTKMHEIGNIKAIMNWE